jgi:hypothetical protein
MSTPTTTTTTTTTTNQSTIKSQLKNFGILILGAAIFSFHIGLFYWNTYVFNIFVCMYIIMFTTFVLVFLYQNKKCFVNENRSFNMLSYFALYTLFLQVSMILLSIVFLIMRPKY